LPASESLRYSRSRDGEISGGSKLAGIKVHRTIGLRPCTHRHPWHLVNAESSLPLHNVHITDIMHPGGSAIQSRSRKVKYGLQDLSTAALRSAVGRVLGGRRWRPLADGHGQCLISLVATSVSDRSALLLCNCGVLLWSQRAFCAGRDISLNLCGGEVSRLVPAFWPPQNYRKCGRK
jgi:hypothetical protein